MSIPAESIDPSYCPDDESEDDESDDDEVDVDEVDESEVVLFDYDDDDEDDEPGDFYVSMDEVDVCFILQIFHIIIMISFILLPVRASYFLLSCSCYYPKPFFFFLVTEI